MANPPTDEADAGAKGNLHTQAIVKMHQTSTNASGVARCAPVDKMETPHSDNFRPAGST